MTKLSILLFGAAAVGIAVANAGAQPPISSLTARQSQAPVSGPTASRPWMNRALSPERRVAMLLPRMTAQEKQVLVFGYLGTEFKFQKYDVPAEAREGSAGYVPGVPRLGIPPQWQTDAGIGVATQGAAKHKRERTSLPSGLGTAATWNVDLAKKAGAMIGAEARASGFNVMLGGGVNLVREPRNGRNTEYAGEDPLLAGVMVGAQIAGIQSNNIISTVKHFAINDQETDRNDGNAIIDRKAARLSDLLAFEFAIDRGDPGSVMCSYNLVNGVHACENSWLLTDVLRRDWGFKGYVMSDWGGVHSTVPSIEAGLDQQSGYPFAPAPYYGTDLAKAVARGSVSAQQVDQMASRILFSMFKYGLFDAPITSALQDLPDDTLTRDAQKSRSDAAESIVLMKNEGGILPLTDHAKRIVVIGGHADKGVLAGGGSSLVYPKGGNAVPDAQPTAWPGPVMFYPSSPLNALRRRLPGATISFVDAQNPAVAAAAARDADVAIVFATQWAGESFDVSLTLSDNQDAVIDAVAGANPNTVVVLETGGAVLTPWAAKVPAVLEAWYPGTAGGEALGDILTGRVNPSGHLPISFPNSLAELPHPGEPGKGQFNYTEGAAVGYKWYDKTGGTPAFPFGRGLSYTNFTFDNFAAAGLKVRFTVQNTGRIPGMSVAQIYASSRGWESPRRLVGFTKVMLNAGQQSAATVQIDPRSLADWDDANRCWRVTPGTFRMTLGGSSADAKLATTLTLSSVAVAQLRGTCAKPRRNDRNRQ